MAEPKRRVELDGYCKILGLENETEFLVMICTQLRTKAEKSKILAKRSGSPADKKLAEDKIAHNGAEVGLDKLLVKATSALTKSKLEKEQITAEIEAFISKDSYKKTTYQKNRSKVDHLLNQLRGKQQKQVPTSPKSNLTKTLEIVALIVVPVALLVGIIVHQRRVKSRQKR